MLGGSPSMDLTRYIRDVPDFPAPGVLFRDITPLLQEPAALAFALDEMAADVQRRGATAIVGIESRGFLFGVPVAARLGLPFVPVRKPGKLPAARMSVEYSLEYGSGQLDIHADALTQSDRVVVVDDLLATGGTALAAVKLTELLGARVEGLIFLIELAALAGREKLAGYNVRALLRYD
jgi:adenine phosphoribosyltransferase